MPHPLGPPVRGPIGGASPLLGPESSMKLQEIIETLSLKVAAREAGLDFRMAYATVEHVDVALFAPLQSRTIAIYPSPPSEKRITLVG